MHRPQYQGFSIKIAVLVAISACLVAPIRVAAQSKASINRYRTMLRAMELADTSQNSLAKDAAMQQDASTRQDALEGGIDPTDYVLGPGDQMVLTIVGKEFRSMSLTVLGQGEVIIQDIGQFHLAGRTITDAESLLAKAITPMYRDAKVRLMLVTMRKFRVYLAGFVTKHDVILASPIDRVSTMIERANGFAKKGTNSLSASFRNIRVQHADGTVEVADLGPFFYVGDLSTNPRVRDGDVIYVPYSSSVEEVTISGAVGMQGDYLYAATDSLSTLLTMAQGFQAGAFLDSVEVARFSTDGISVNRTYVDCRGYTYEKSRAGRLRLLHDIPLSQGDQVFVRERPEWHLTHTVAIAGEVRYPGRYPIIRDSTRLSELLARAGGVNSDASVAEAELVRRSSLRDVDREFERLTKMIPSEMTKDEYEYFKAKARERPGVIVIDFKKLYQLHDRREDIVLRDDDSIFVPEVRNTITIIGRVNNPGRVIYEAGVRYEVYVQRAGGYGYRADESGIRVIKARTGELYDPRGSSKYDLEPGDTIFVPEESEVSIWPSVVQGIVILAQLAGILFGVIALSRK